MLTRRAPAKAPECDARPDRWSNEAGGTNTARGERPCTMTAELVLDLKNDQAEIKRLTASLTEFGLRHALPHRIVADVNLALEEAITNIVLYAYDDTGDHQIGVLISLTDGLLTAELIDDGRAFDPLQVAAPDVSARLADRPIGGLGIYLVRHLMDDIQYRREGGRNHLVFTKRTA